MKIQNLVIAAACASVCAGSASAAGLKPGLYTLVGNATQSICLETGGTWYSPTYAGWSGQWLVSADGNAHIFGNYNSGAGNDSIVIGKSKSWTEWSDDLTAVYISDPITFTKAGKCVTGPTAAPAGNGRSPNQR